MNDQDRLAIAAKQHEVGFPVAWFGSFVGALGSFADGNTVLDEVDRTGAPSAMAPAAVLVARQQVVPVVLLRGSMIHEAIDRLVADNGATMQARQPAGDLLRRPAHRKEVADATPQGWLARQLVASAASSSSVGQDDGSLGIVSARPANGGWAGCCGAARG